MEAPVEKATKSLPSGSGLRRVASTGRKVVGKVAHFVSKRGGPRGFDRARLALAAKRYPVLVGKPIHLIGKLKTAAIGLEKEATLGPVLSGEVDAAIRRMTAHDPGLRGMLDKAYGYAVFPLVGKAAAAVGIGFGRGEVFEQGKLIGYAALAQVTLGVQVGGQTYDELVVFQDEGALERFKSGNLAFAMNASAVLVKAGAAATTNFASGTAVFVHPEGGLGIELGLGGQKFIFRPTVLGAPAVELEGAEKQAATTAERVKEVGEAGGGAVATAAAAPQEVQEVTERAKEVGEAGGGAVATAAAAKTQEVAERAKGVAERAKGAAERAKGAGEEAGRAVKRRVGVLAGTGRAMVARGAAAAQKKAQGLRRPKA